MANIRLKQTLFLTNIFFFGHIRAVNHLTVTTSCNTAKAICLTGTQTRSIQQLVGFCIKNHCYLCISLNIYVVKQDILHAVLEVLFASKMKVPTLGLTKQLHSPLKNEEEMRRKCVLWVPLCRCTFSKGHLIQCGLLTLPS